MNPLGQNLPPRPVDAKVFAGRDPARPRRYLLLSEIEMVEYHLLDSSIPEPNVPVGSPTNGFEYRLWLYGFIRVSADVITRTGELIQLQPTEISWAATDAEKKLNGENELSW